MHFLLSLGLLVHSIEHSEFVAYRTDKRETRVDGLRVRGTGSSNISVSAAIPNSFLTASVGVVVVSVCMGIVRKPTIDFGGEYAIA